MEHYDNVAYYDQVTRYECEIITQIYNFGCRGLSVATIYGQGKIAESQRKVREKSGNFFFQVLWEPCNDICKTK